MTAHPQAWRNGASLYAGSATYDGTVGLYFMGFCREQAPMRERMEAMYAMNGQQHDALTDYSTPASGSYYFAPSVETLDRMLT